MTATKNYYEKNEKKVLMIDIPFLIPTNWCWAKSKQLLSNVQYGFNGAGVANGIYKLLRITDIQNGDVNWETLPCCDIEVARANDYQIKKEDIFIARTGGTIGKSYRLREAKERIIFAGYLIRFQFVEQCFSSYVEKYLNSQLYWNEVAKKSAGTGQPNINGVSLSNLLIPVPPINEQKRIINKINKIFDFIETNQFL